MKPSKILWLTDVHMTAEGALLKGRDPGRYLAAALDHALAHHRDLDACVVSGDLVDRAGAGEYERVRAGLARIKVPMAMTIGNHDRRDAFLRAFRPAAAAGPAHDLLDLGAEWRLLLVDSTTEDPERGSLAPDRLAWLETGLAEAGPRHVAVFLHHPPMKTGIPGADGSGLGAADKRAFAECMVRHRDRVRLVGFGHCHRPFSGSMAGIPFVGLASVLFQALPNFADNRFVPDPAGRGCYGVVLLGDGDVVVHTVAVGREAG